MEDRDLVSEAVEELRRQNRSQADFRNQQQGRTAQVADDLDRPQVHFGFPGTGHAFQEERLEARLADGRFDCAQRGPLGLVEGEARFRRARGLAAPQGAQLHGASFRELPRNAGNIAALDRERPEVVGPGMALQVVQQPAFSGSEPRRSGARRTGLDRLEPMRGQAGTGPFDRLLDQDQAAPLQPLDSLPCARVLALQIRQRQGPPTQREEDGGLRHRGAQRSPRFVRRCRPRRGKGNNLLRAGLAAERQHRLQRFSDRSAIVGGNPAAQFDQLGAQDRLRVQQFPDRTDGEVGFRSVRSQHDAGQRTRAQRHLHPAADPDARAQIVGKRVSEGPVQRDGKRGVAIRWDGVVSRIRPHHSKWGARRSAQSAYPASLRWSPSSTKSSGRGRPSAPSIGPAMSTYSSLAHSAASALIRAFASRIASISAQRRRLGLIETNTIFVSGRAARSLSTR